MAAGGTRDLTLGIRVGTGAVLTLVGLALIDSTSIGTLFLPVWMLLSPQLRASRFAAYLATVAGFYLLVGVVLVAGAGALRDALSSATSDLGDSTALGWVQLALGVGMFALSFRYEPKRIAARRHSGTPDRAARWRSRLTGPDATYGAAVAVGVTAAGLEVATMLPYLGAVGLITAADLPVVQWIAVLAGYVLVMVLPALVLFGARTAAWSRVEPMLVRLGAWMTKHSQGALGWILALVGFWVAADAAGRIGLLG